MDPSTPNGQRTPFQDISNTHSLDPKEIKRQRERERYAQNRDEINKRRRETYKQKRIAQAENNGLNNDTQSAVSRERNGLKNRGSRERQQQPCNQNKHIAAVLDGSNIVSQVPATGQSTVTQLQNIAGAAGAVPNCMHINRLIIDKDNIYEDDESDWLHRNDAYQMQRNSSRKSLTQMSTDDNPQLSTEVTLRTPEEWQRNKGTESFHGSKEPVPMQSDGNNPVMEPFPRAGQATHDLIANDHVEDPYGILEPDVDTINIDDCLGDGNLGETGDGNLGETGYDGPDDEARMFAQPAIDFESYRVGAVHGDGTPTNDAHDRVYMNLPKKHHVLRKVSDCRHCGALRFQYEGPAFCCRKGKVGVVTPDVSDELKRLFRSQDDEDAKYFRENIRYFNSHFSFTTLGVTLDRRVSTAAGTGVYTFRACGQLYHALDDLMSGDNGPRHLQLYIYDTDENLFHRVKRSPNLRLDLIQKILEILEHNPYAQAFKSIGAVPNLDEYRISLNTDINLDQRRYNAPTTSQVAAIWVEGSDPQKSFDRSVVVYGKGDRPVYIRAYYGCYDPLSYPLFFPRGEIGWNRWMPYIGTPDDTNQDSMHDSGRQGNQASSFPSGMMFIIDLYTY